MQRRTFIRLTGLGSAFVLGGGVSSLLSSCRKEMLMESVRPINVIEGNFSQALVFKSEFNQGQTLLAHRSVTNGFQLNQSRCLGYASLNSVMEEGLLGPTIRASSGSSITIPFRNDLEDFTNIHFHGLVVPANMDGHPEDVVGPGASFDYTFNVFNRAGMYWYHPHTHGTTGKQAYLGLAGVFIVNDPEEQSLNLPTGNEELILVLQDKRILPDYALDYSPSMSDVMQGYMGEYVFVNGIYAPYHNVSRKTYRLRVLNGSNARIYNLAFSNNQSFFVIGSDGGLLTVPVTVNSLLLGPGERADIIVSFSALTVGQEVFLVNKTFNGGAAQGTQEFKIMKFAVNDNTTDTFTLPGTLSSEAIIDWQNADRTRTFNISNHSHEHMGHGGSMSGMHKINDKIFDVNRIDETVTLGDTEIWVFDNSEGEEPHPMHIHGVQFRVIDRTGGRGALIATENHLKDTVMVMPGEKVRVAMLFVTYPGKFVFHCHNLEHADDGMMLQYQITF